MDDTRLTGYSRLRQQQIGFENEGADVAYFNFDESGAYAPAFPSLTADEVKSIEETPGREAGSVKASVEGGMLTLSGVEDGATVAVYSMNGTQVARVPHYSDGTGIALPGRGLYVVLVQMGDQKRETFKVIY